MKNIFSAEIYKLYKSNTVRITIIVCIIYAILISMYAETPSMPDYMMTSRMSLFLSLTISSNIVMLGGGVLAGNYIVGEFDGGTVKNTLSRGTSRVAYYFAKLVCMMSLFILITLLGAFIFALLMKRNGWDNTFIVYEQYTLKLFVFTCVIIGYYLMCASAFVMISFIFQHSQSLVQRFINTQTLKIQLINQHISS